LIAHPKSVLADEPTDKNLDEMVELIKKANKEQGCTILLVTRTTAFDMPIVSFPWKMDIYSISAVVERQQNE